MTSFVSRTKKVLKKARTFLCTAVAVGMMSVCAFAAEGGEGAAIATAMTEQMTSLKGMLVPVIGAVAVGALAILIMRLGWSKGIALFKSFVTKA